MIAKGIFHMKKNEYKDDNSKERILEAATELFARKGFDGTSIREICKKAEVNICMISYYWGGKKELYQGIIDNLIEKQLEYSKQFVDFDKDISKISKEEQIELLLFALDKFIDFFYAKFSKNLLIILLKEQQSENFINTPPALVFLRRLLANILGKDEMDREIILKTLFVISQINSPRIMPSFSLKLLGQDDFIQDDIKIIKDNVKSYVKMLIKEACVD